MRCQLGSERANHAPLTSGARPFKRALERGKFSRSANERREATRRLRVPGCPSCGAADDPKDRQRLSKALHWNVAKRLHFDEALSQPNDIGRAANRARFGDLLHPRRNMHRWPDRVIVE